MGDLAHVHARATPTGTRGRRRRRPAVTLHAAGAWLAAGPCSGSRPVSTAFRPPTTPSERRRARAPRAQQQRSERAAHKPPRARSSSAIGLGVEGDVFGRAPAARACRCAPRPSTCARAGGVHSVPSAHAAWNILRAGRGPRPSCARRRRHAGKDRALVRRGRVDSPRRARTGGRSRALPRTRTSRSPESCSLAKASLGAACRAGRHRLAERAELRDALAAAGSSTTAAKATIGCLTRYAAISELTVRSRPSSL